MSKKTAKLPDIEASLKEINSLIEKMEQGDLSLEQSLASFEKGIHLIKHAQIILQKAEQKVQILTQHSNVEALETYKSNEDDSFSQ